MAPHHSQANDIQEHIPFARHNLDNHQAMIRLADAKAGVLVTLLLFLGATTIPLGKDAIPVLRWAPRAGALTSCIYLLSYGAFALGFIWALIMISKALTPREATHYRQADLQCNLFYFKHIARFPSNDKYFEAVQHASPELLLRNLTDQLFELAHICEQKMHNLKMASSPVKLALSAWTVNTILGLYMLRWK